MFLPNSPETSVGAFLLRATSYASLVGTSQSCGQATGRELHTGPPPDHSTVLEVPLFSGRTIKARIGAFSAEGVVRRKGSALMLVTEIYADEI